MEMQQIQRSEPSPRSWPVSRAERDAIVAQRHQALVAALLIALAAGPKPLRELARPLGVTPERVRQLLRALLATRQVKRVGRYQRARWALLGWVEAPAAPRYAVPETSKPFVVPSGVSPTHSWWVGVPRDRFASTQATHMERMRGSQAARDVDPSPRERDR